VEKRSATKSPTERLERFKRIVTKKLRPTKRVSFLNPEKTMGVQSTIFEGDGDRGILPGGGTVKEVNKSAEQKGV